VDDDQEQECVRRAKAGDRAAFGALVGRYWGPVRAWLAGLAGSDDGADDRTQEAFLKAWTNLPRLAADGAFRVWLFRIARNEFLAARRAGKDQPASPAEDRPDPAPGPVAAAAAAEAGAAARAAVAGLPEPYREAYLLWVHDGLPYSELARVFGVSEDTCRWRVCQARKLLAAALAPYLDRPDR